MSKRRERDGIEVGEMERQKQEEGGKRGRGGEGSRFMKPLECNLEAEITVSLSKV